MKFLTKALYLITLVVFFIACQNSHSGYVNSSKTEDKVKLEAQDGREYLTIGQVIKLRYYSNTIFDSIEFFINNKRASLALINDSLIEIKTDSLNVGTLNLKLRTCFPSGEKETDYAGFYLKSDIKPEVAEWKVKRTIPHSIKSYTQGLIYIEDTIFESTGQWGQSKLFKINPLNGDIYKERPIPSKYFGEGIAIYKDLLFQITYRAREAFIYDRFTLETRASVNYNNDEGWGLTTVDSFLVMSDGSERLFWRNTNDFSIYKILEVYDNNGLLSRLNELEYINGYIFANIYMTNKIAVINPGNGKVVSYFNLDGLLNDKYKHPQIDVLNGIAYNSEKEELILTGKNWPLIFFCEFNIKSE